MAELEEKIQDTYCLQAANEEDMKKQNEIQKLLQKGREDPNIAAVLLYGSRARSEETPFSDVDVCLISRKKPSIQEKLKYLEYDLDLHFFRDLPLYIRKRVIQEGKILLSKDDPFLYDLAYRTIRDFEDFKPYYYQYLKAVESA